MVKILRWNFNNQIIQFLLAGCVSAFVEFISFIFAVKITKSVFWPALFSFCCGFASSYVLNSRVVFGATDRSMKREGMQLIAFLMLGVFNALVSSWSVLFLSHNIPKIIAKLCVIIIIAMWNYIIMKNIIFRDSN